MRYPCNVTPRRLRYAGEYECGTSFFVVLGQETCWQRRPFKRRRGIISMTKLTGHLFWCVHQRRLNRMGVRRTSEYGTCKAVKARSWPWQPSSLGRTIGSAGFGVCFGQTLAGCSGSGFVPLPIECGTHKTVRTRIWPKLSGFKKVSGVPFLHGSGSGFRVHVPDGWCEHAMPLPSKERTLQTVFRTLT